MRIERFAVAAAAVLAFTACSDGTTDPIEHNFEYVLTVSGGMTAELRGAAFFGADTNEQGEAAFAVLPGSDTSSHIVVLSREGAARPGTGTYDITGLEAGSAAWTGLLINAENEELTGLFVSEQGRLTVTESTALRLKGTVDFTAVGFLDEDAADPVQVRITGTFDARQAPASALRITGS